MHVIPAKAGIHAEPQESQLLRLRFIQHGLPRGAEPARERREAGNGVVGRGNDIFCPGNFWQNNAQETDSLNINLIEG
jgi:hypothetical protein